MRNQIRNALVISLLLITVPTINAQANKAELTVSLVNTADVGPKVLKSAIEVAARILQRTGIEMFVVDCCQDGNGKAPSCSGFTGHNQISIRLVRRPKQDVEAIGFRRLGMALKLDEPTGSGMVYLFCEAIEELAGDRRVPMGVLLGVVMTHEIGHLLIGPGHSKKGIMGSGLGEPEWQEASQGMLRFTDRQSETLRNGVLSRKE